MAKPSSTSRNTASASTEVSVATVASSILPGKASNSKNPQQSTTTTERHIPGWPRLLYIPVVVVLSSTYFWGLRSENGRVLTMAWLAIGCLGIATMIAGLLYYRPRYKWPWWCFIAANICFVGGDAYYNTIVYVQGLPDPYPSLGDAMYLATYPLFATGMYLLIRRRTPKRSDKGSLLDALTITVSLALVLWVYLIVPTLHSDGTALSRTVSIAYPLGDVLVWALLIRLLIVDIRTRAVQLLAIGAFGLISADIIYSISQLNGIWQNNFTDLGWILFYTAWGAAALHPSMLRLSEPLDQQAMQVRARRLIILSLAALVAPLILLIKAWQGQAGEIAGSVAGFAALLFVLVILRLYILTREVGRREAELRLTQEKSELLAISSHQLRTPLTTIKLYVEMLDNPKVHANPAQIAKYADVLRNANESMIDIVNSLIYTAQLDMGEIQFKRERVLVTPALDKALQSAQTLVDVAGKPPVQVVNKLPSDLAVQADTQAFIIILTGVLTNAFQYGNETNPTVTLSATTDTAARTVTIDIADNGAGIPEADKPKIFGKLFRASNARRMSPDGSGLNLYMARSALSYLDGSIALDSTEGIGTTVSITLPAGE